MGRQSSRIYFNGQDHKEMVTWDGTQYVYHDKAYIWNGSEFELVWEKLPDEEFEGMVISTMPYYIGSTSVNVRGFHIGFANNEAYLYLRILNYGQTQITPKIFKRSIKELEKYRYSDGPVDWESEETWIEDTEGVIPDIDPVYGVIYDGHTLYDIDHKEFIYRNQDIRVVSIIPGQTYSGSMLLRDGYRYNDDFRIFHTDGVGSTSMSALSSSIYLVPIVPNRRATFPFWYDTVGILKYDSGSYHYFVIKVDDVGIPNVVSDEEISLPYEAGNFVLSCNNHWPDIIKNETTYLAKVENGHLRVVEFTDEGVGSDTIYDEIDFDGSNQGVLAISPNGRYVLYKEGSYSPAIGDRGSAHLYDLKKKEDYRLHILLGTSGRISNFIPSSSFNWYFLSNRILCSEYTSSGKYVNLYTLY